MFTEFAAWLQATPISVAIQSIHWVIPLVQSIHIVTIGIVFVSILVVVLRLFGLASADQAFPAVLNRYSPWIGYGLIVMTLTGATLIVGEPIRQFTATSFWLKMGLLAICVVSAAAFRYSMASAQRAADGEPVISTGRKSVAVAVLFLWVAVIFLGRAIAYDTQVWASWSLANG